MGVWIEKAPMPTNRHDLQAIAVEGEIYAISGAGDHTVHVVEIYDVASDTWRPGPPIPTQRGWFGAARVGDEIYACGGKRGAHGGGKSSKPATTITLKSATASRF